MISKLLAIQQEQICHHKSENSELYFGKEHRKKNCHIGRSLKRNKHKVKTKKNEVKKLIDTMS